MFDSEYNLSDDLSCLPFLKTNSLPHVTFQLRSRAVLQNQSHSSLHLDMLNYLHYVRMLQLFVDSNLSVEMFDKVIVGSWCQTASS
jgi:hypothetical protein